MKKAPKSGLSHQILLALSRNPAKSIAALARDLNSLRPSVSRAINSLHKEGLITREGRTLYLTQAGQEEVQRLNAELPIKVKKHTDLATRTLDQAIETWKRIEPGVDHKALD